ncbi:Ig-like domain-containing protein [Aquimarina sp. U1-2]|uniref:InlB B-repeat-containing protein n=1 Tax=Aquimarina sp. U1-2 TaxID=2823141 RepID=UPI001AECFE00|nr:Ig-like domain-containing protein [Aquimarina sp. U1-2]MBP2833456.1 Ig-like domain-containing protein [Aquimarina sp. U1-2]
MKKTYLILWACLISIVATGQIEINIDTEGIKGPALRDLYGISAFSGSSLNVANNNDYQKWVDEMAPSFVRFHASNHNKCGHAGTWIDCNNETWDEDRIVDILEEFSVDGSGMMLTVFNYPPWKLLGKKKPSKLDIEFYAKWCAELVRIVNIKHGFNVKYWEPFNEWDGKGYSGIEMAEHYDACYTAMKAVDPSIKICGPVTRNSSDKTIVPFLQNIKRPLDLFSYHEYGGGGTGSRDGVYKRTKKLLNGARNVRNKLNANGFSNVPSFIGEWNIVWSWNAPGWEFQVNEVGAVYDALSFKYLIEDGPANNVIAMTAWEDAGGNYGKIKKRFDGFNPGGHVFDLFNEHAVGNAVRSISSSPDQVEAFTVLQSNGSAMVAVMNRGFSGTKNVKLNTNGWAPLDPSSIKKYVINNRGRSESTVSWSSITERSFSIQEDNVIIFVIGESAPAPAPESIAINNCNNTMLTIGDEYVLNFSVSPTGANRSVQWISDNPAVASVDNQGKVKAITAGEALITVTSTENRNVKATCTISVKEPTPDTFPWVENFQLSDGIDNDKGATGWVASRTSGTFSVQGNRFTTNGSGSEGMFTTNFIDISTTASATLTVAMDTEGSIDGPGPYADYIKIYTSTDGGDFVLQHEETAGNINAKVVEIPIRYGDLLRVRVVVKTTAADEFIFIDRISVTQNSDVELYSLTVASGNGSGSYPEGTQVVITANEAPDNFVFDRWSGDVSYLADKTSAETIVTMPAQTISVTAMYKELPVSDGPCAITGGSIQLKNVLTGTFLFARGATGTVSSSTSNSDAGIWEAIKINDKQWQLKNMAYDLHAYGRNDGKIKLGTGNTSNYLWEFEELNGKCVCKNVQSNNYVGLNGSGWVRLQSTLDADTYWEIVPKEGAQEVNVSQLSTKLSVKGIKMFPNPLKYRSLNIIAPMVIERLIVADLSGKIIYEAFPDQDAAIVPASIFTESGVKIIKVIIEGQTIIEKLLVK